MFKRINYTYTSVLDRRGERKARKALAKASPLERHGYNMLVLTEQMQARMNALKADENFGALYRSTVAKDVKERFSDLNDAFERAAKREEFTKVDVAKEAPKLLTVKKSTQRPQQ